MGFVIKAGMDDLSLKWENIKSETIRCDVIFKDVPEEWVKE